MLKSILLASLASVTMAVHLGYYDSNGNYVYKEKSFEKDEEA